MDLVVIWFYSFDIYECIFVLLMIIYDMLFIM